MTNYPTIYLDNAAATPVDPKVIKEMLPFFHDNFYNPSAGYSAARNVRKKLETARAEVAYWLGAQSAEITFTAGGTEANNLAIHGIMHTNPKASIVVSQIEHESVMKPSKRYPCRTVAVRSDGIIDIAALRHAIDETTVLVSIMYANNEIGTIEPVHEVAKVIREIRLERQVALSKTDILSPPKPLPLYLHTDACQAANYLDLHVERLGVDMMTLNGSKIYGPKQSGALYVKRGIVVSPIIEGGGQEYGLRSGTENVAGALGFSTALVQAQTMRRDEALRMQALQQTFFGAVKQLLPSVKVNGSTKHRLVNNIHLTFPGQDNERLLFSLDEVGILAAAGSACSASTDEPSHVLRAIGLSDVDAQGSIRFTMGRMTTKDMILKTVQMLARLTA